MSSAPLTALPARVLGWLLRQNRPGLRIDRAYAARRPLVPANLPRHGPLISVVMPAHDTPAGLLRAALASVIGQSYQDWELCVCDDASDTPHVGALIAATADARVRSVRLAKGRGIAGATNAALSLASGVFVALLDHDDALPPHALARVAAEIAACPDAELLFSDEDKIAGGRLCCPYFKPGWDPELMEGQNLVSHLGVYKRARLLEIGGLREGFEGSQDYDLALRFAAACGAERIRHIPEVLYHWRQLPGSFSQSRAAQAARAGRQALADARPGAVVQSDPSVAHWHRVVRALTAPAPLVSMIVAEGAAPLDAEYASVEVLRGNREEAAARARGAVLLFVAQGLSGGAPGWLRELASQAMRAEIGAAGGRLDRPDGRVAHSGTVLDLRRIALTVAPGSDADDPGYFGQFRLVRSVSAVSSDCLAVRRALFVEMGGFDAACGAYADVDFCLRLAARGLRCVWTPHARLRYTRRPPRTALDAGAARLMRKRWGSVLARDPYLNPNLAVRGGSLVLRTRPLAAQRIPA